MQTAAISYRVADFLKQHPPFQTMEECDLLALVEHGRVRFHEADEYIYWQGKAHAPFVYVIQQGTVSLWEEAEGGERLRDVRGAGDMLGIDRFLGSETSLYSAKTCSDMVIYALRAVDFEPLLAKYFQAGRYVASHAAVSTDYQQPDRRRAAHETFLSDLVEFRPPLTCPAGETLRGAARLMTAAGAQAVAMVDEHHHLAGLVTSEGILRSIAAGADPESSAEIGEPCVVAPDSTVSQCVLAMADAHVDAVAVAGGAGKFNSLVTAADLSPAFQDQPVGILRAVPYAPDTATLRRLHQRLRGFLLEQLVTPSAVDWLIRLAHRFDAAVLKRVVELHGLADAECCWCFYGAAGRGESLSPAAPQIAVIHRQPYRQPCRCGQALEAFGECGYLLPGTVSCAGLEEWKGRFRSWVQDPLNGQMYLARPLFDLRPVLGPEQPWRELAAEVVGVVQAEGVFIRLLANDCLASLPPLTFFRDLVIEDSGERSDVFHLESSAVQPLVDVGRVFGIAAGRALFGSTVERFALARTLIPDREAIFREAVEAFRVVLYHQARTGIRQGSNGSELPPVLLSRYDRQILKGCFRSVHRLLEFTAECQWLEKA